MKIKVFSNFSSRWVLCDVDTNVRAKEKRPESIYMRYFCCNQLMQVFQLLRSRNGMQRKIGNKSLLKSFSFVLILSLSSLFSTRKDWSHKEILRFVMTQLFFSNAALCLLLLLLKCILLHEEWQDHSLLVQAHGFVHLSKRRDQVETNTENMRSFCSFVWAVWITFLLNALRLWT